MPPAARMTDPHKCGVPLHGVNKIEAPCCTTVDIGRLPAARVGDACTCGATIEEGSPTVLIGGQMAARQNDPTNHPGQIIKGEPTVLIGIPGKGCQCSQHGAKKGAPLIKKQPKKGKPGKGGAKKSRLFKLQATKIGDAQPPDAPSDLQNIATGMEALGEGFGEGAGKLADWFKSAGLVLSKEGNPAGAPMVAIGTFISTVKTLTGCIPHHIDLTSDKKKRDEDFKKAREKGEEEAFKDKLKDNPVTEKGKEAGKEAAKKAGEALKKGWEQFLKNFPKKP